MLLLALGISSTMELPLEEKETDEKEIMEKDLDTVDSGPPPAVEAYASRRKSKSSKSRPSKGKGTRKTRKGGKGSNQNQNGGNNNNNGGSSSGWQQVVENIGVAGVDSLITNGLDHLLGQIDGGDDYAGEYEAEY